MGQYTQSLKPGPDSVWPLAKLPEQVACAVEQAMKGRPREEVSREVRKAVRDVLFLFHLHQKVNSKLMEEDRHYWTKGLLLVKELSALRRERLLRDQLAWGRMRVGMELPYPLDPESAAAVEAAKEHYVMTWELLEEGDNILNWVLERFVAEGRTALPEGVYLLQHGGKSLYTTVPTEADVRALFQEEVAFQKFMAGEDYRYCLADVPDAEFESRYDAVFQAMRALVDSGQVREGFVVELSTVPHHVLRDAPLVEGEWLDRYVAELAEWGARLEGKGYQLQEPEDSHPMAWHHIVDPQTGAEADAAVLDKLWRQTGQHLKRFPGETRDIGGREYLRFADYLSWRGRRVKGSLGSDPRRGLVVPSWNRWMEGNGGDGAAHLAGVLVGRLRCYLEGYQYHICPDADGLTEERRRRETLLDTLRGWRPGSRGDQRFYRQLESWKELAEDFLYDLYSLRRVVDTISQRYFDGQQALFPTPAEEFSRLLANVEKLVAEYNEDLVNELKPSVRSAGETPNGTDSLRLVDTAIVEKAAAQAASERARFLVDMARAEALDTMGENRWACEVMERHL